MADWTTPHTWMVDEEAGAALMNTYLRDNTQYLYDRLTYASGTASLPATFAPGTATVTGSSMTLAAGSWLVWASVGYSGTGADSRLLSWIQRTSGSTATLASVYHASGSGPADGIANCSLQVAVTPVASSTYAVQGSNLDGYGSMVTAMFTAVRLAV